jgi:hypothetical protein
MEVFRRCRCSRQINFDLHPACERQMLLGARHHFVFFDLFPLLNYAATLICASLLNS